ncbi:MAG: high-affinity branched-chain amino acid ABC transporter permease LivM [Dongiaceae bacterium]
MTDIATRAPVGAQVRRSAMIEAGKEAAATALIVFLLSFFMVGFKTEANQGQPLGYVTQFVDVAWACVLVSVGRFAIALDRHGVSKPALIGGLLSFIYLAGIGVIGVAEQDPDSAAATGFYNVLGINVPMPFEQPMVNVIFGFGGLTMFGIAYRRLRVARHGALTVEVREATEERRAQWARRMSGTLGPILIVLAICVPIFMPISPWSNATRQVVDSLVLVLTYVMLGWGLNIVVGLAGLLDLGYVAFYAVGAYTYGLISTSFGLNFWECMPLAGALAATFGLLLGFPVLRLRGDYLAIVTLGFGEMIRLILINWKDFTHGPDGITNIPKIDFFGVFTMERHAPEGHVTFAEFFGMDYSPTQRVYFLYYVILVLALITNFVTIRLRKLPIGRAWEALREDETACRALGINPTNTKLTAFAMGAMFAGFAGSFFATRQGFISPESFVFLESAQILAIVVLGGMGSQVGVALAAILLVGLPEVMRELALYRMLIYGIAMVLIMIWRPRGLLAHREPTILLRRRTGNGAGK